MKEWHPKVDGSVGDRFAYDDFGRMTGAKLGVQTAADMNTPTFSAAAAKKTSGYAIDAGNSWSTVVETVLNQPPQTTSYTATSYTTTDSSRYVQISAGGASVVPTYDGEGNLTFDGQFYLVYDFKNRLSEVWRLSVDGQALQSNATFVSLDAMKVGRTRVLNALAEREKDVQEDHANLSQQGALETTVQGSSNGSAQAVVAGAVLLRLRA